MQPMFILRHLQHAAGTMKPNNSYRLHTAFIDFKQADDTIPRKPFWFHFSCIRMPVPLLSAIQNLYVTTSTSYKTGKNPLGLSRL